MIEPVFKIRKGESEQTFDEFCNLAYILFESYKYLYEPLGNIKSEDNNQYDKHMYHLVKKALGLGAKNIDGSAINLPENKDPFGEDTHSHLIRFFAIGSNWTNYKLEGDNLGGLHNGGDDLFIISAFPLLALAPLQEIGGFLFPTDTNYYEESANKTLLSDKKYDNKPDFPIYYKQHKHLFTDNYFESINISKEMLSVNFCNNAQNIEASRTLNYSLKLMYSSVLMDYGMQLIFGKEQEKQKQIKYIDQKWNYEKMSKELAPKRLALLSILVAPLHFIAFAYTYAIYRNKFGISYQDLYPEGKSLHGGWYFGRDKNRIPFKKQLTKSIRIKIQDWNNQINSSNSEKEIKILTQNIKCALELGAYFGVAYKTSPYHKENPHIDVPVDFTPKQLSTKLKNIDFVVHHNENSILYYFWYKYTGDLFFYDDLIQIKQNDRSGKIGQSPWGVFLTHSFKYMMEFCQNNFESVEEINLYKQKVIKELFK